MKIFKYLFALLFIIGIQQKTINAQSPKTLKSTCFFIENKGQWNEEVLFYSSIPSANIWITKTGVVFDYFSIQENEQNIREGHVIKYTFSNSSIPDSICKLKEREEYSNYFIGKDKSSWASSVHHYEEVILKNIYYGIDARFYFEGANLRYDFIAYPKSNLDQIQIQIEGGEDYKKSNDGFNFNTSLGQVNHAGLSVFENGKSIPGKFQLLKNTFSFKAEVKSKKDTIVIDPVISCTFLGGNTIDQAYAIALDGESNVYITGYSYSVDFPVSTGAYKISNAGKKDVVLSKMNGELSKLIYSTYIGSSADDEGFGITLDKFDNIFVTGICNYGFPTTAGAYDVSANGNTDGFVIKFNNAGSFIFFSTYLGGSERDWLNDIKVNKDGQIYVTGETESANYPTTINGFDTVFSGISNVIFSKLNSAGSVLEYSTFFGDSLRNSASELRINANAEIYIAGTASKHFPYTIGAFDTTLLSSTKCFVLKLDSANTKLLYSTFIGGNKGDGCTAMDIDSFGCAYITGTTNSDTFPISSNAVKKTKTAVSAFVFKLSQNGDSMVYSTFIYENTSPQCIAVDKNGFVVTAGTTDLYSFPITKYNLQSNQQGFGNTEGYICRLGSEGEKRTFSTFYGGDGTARTASIVMDQFNHFYLTGRAILPGLTTSANAYQKTMSSIEEIFISHIKPCGHNIYIKKPKTICFMDTVVLQIDSIKKEMTYYWETPSGNTIMDSFLTINNIQIADKGWYKFMAVDTNFCTAIDSFEVKVNKVIGISSSALKTPCKGDTLMLFTTASKSQKYDWVGPDSFKSSLYNPIIPNLGIKNNGRYKIKLTDFNGCIDTSSIFVNIKTPAQIVINSNSPICNYDSILIFAADKNEFNTIKWKGPLGFSDSQFSITRVNNNILHTGFYYANLVDTNDCFVSDSVFIEVNELAKVTIVSQTIVCIDDTLRLNYSSDSVLMSFHWTGPNGFSSNLDAPTISNLNDINSGNYYFSYLDINGCKDTVFKNHLISHPLFFTIKGSTKICIKDSLILQPSLANNDNYSYTWSTGKNRGVGTSKIYINPNFNIIDTGKYFLELNDGYCLSIDSIIIKSNPQPEINLKDAQLVCENNNYKLEDGINSAIRFLWHGPNNFSSNLKNPSLKNFTSINNGWYTLKIWDSLNCFNSDSTNLQSKAIEFPIVTQFGGTLKCENIDASYQWINCMPLQIILNDTFANFKPKENGTFAVILTKNQCKDTSSCYSINNVNTPKLYNTNHLIVYPNPAKNELMLKNLATGEQIINVKIIDNIGRLVLEKTNLGNNNSINFNLPMGIYSIIITTERRTEIIKLSVDMNQ